MSGLLVPKRTAEVRDVGWGVCLWKLPQGGHIQDKDNNYLCAYGRTMDKTIEAKMRSAAASLGILVGEPQWMPGFRKIDQNEYEDEMEELLDGGTPDPVDIWRQATGLI